MTAEPNRPSGAPSPAGLPGHAEALAIVDRARRLRGETLARLARAALSWMRHRPSTERAVPVGGMPHARA